MATTPITEVRDPGVVSHVYCDYGTVSIAGGMLPVIINGGTVSVMAVPGQPIPVTITGGSLSLNIAPGDITIAAVEIEDKASGLKAAIHAANTAHAATDPVLLVQHVDAAGDVLSQTTLSDIDTNTAATNVLLLEATDAALAIQDTGTRQLAVSSQSLTALNNVYATLGAQEATMTVVMNGQGTMATSAHQLEERSLLTAILNGEGTLATSANQSSNQAESRGIFTAILNGEGTLATSALQSSGNATLALIQDTGSKIYAESLVIASNVNAVTTAVQNFMYWEQSGSLNSPVMTLLSGVTTPQDSPIADVSGYTLHAIQINISGSAVVQMQSSLDSQVWETDTVLLRSKYITTFGKYKYVRVRYRIGNGTVSAFAIASR